MGLIDDAREQLRRLVYGDDHALIDAILAPLAEKLEELEAAVEKAVECVEAIKRLCVPSGYIEIDEAGGDWTVSLCEDEPVSGPSLHAALRAAVEAMDKARERRDE